MKAPQTVGLPHIPGNVELGGPVFLLQIVDKDGAVVRLPAGGKLEAKVNELLTTFICERLRWYHFGSRRRAVISRAIVDAVMSMKLETVGLVG